MPSPLPILEGRRFGCTRCARCCLEPGVVELLDGELERMAEHLQLSVASFRRRFRVRREGGGWYIDALRAGCPLLGADHACTVHPVKPKQCATFPFWDDLLADRAAWDATKSYCPGLDAPEGRLYTRREITAIRGGKRTT